MTNAWDVLTSERARLAATTWTELARQVGHQLYREVITDDGEKFGIEETAMWDGKPERAIRIVVDVFRHDESTGWSPVLTGGVYVVTREGHLEDA